jgi:hypothetical protein
LWRAAVAFGKTPRELLGALTQSEWYELQRYYVQEPFGDRAVQTTIALLSSVVYQMNAAQGAPKLPLDTFMIGARREQTEDEKNEARRQLANSVKQGLRARAKSIDAKKKRRSRNRQG